MIAGRQSQIQRLTEAVFERGRHAVLFGERGVGKTSIANTFYKLFANKLRRVTAIRKPAFPTDTYSSLWRRVFSELSIDATPVSSRYQGEITPDDVVRELSNFSQSTWPIIIIDEFDKFADEMGKRLMSHTIKAISDDAASFATIVIVGVAEDINLLVDEHNSISRNITEIRMPRMSKGEMNELIDQRYARVTMGLEDDARARIIGLARGLPEYVHFLARDAAKAAIESRRLLVQTDDVGIAVSNMIESADQSSESAYNLAVDSNKKNNLYARVLLACSLAKADDSGRFTASDVLPVLSKILDREIKMANFYPHLEAFCFPDRGCILEKKGTTQAYKYRFKEPKMQPYVIMRGLSEGLVPPDFLTVD
jgi:Cdc6-like AAA superfamily ATPase